MLLETPDVEVGWQAAPFKLANPQGNWFSDDQIMGENGMLIAFICNHCPYVKAIIDRLVQDAKILQDEGFGVAAIMSNDYHYVAEDSPENMRSFVKQHGFTFPYLVDEDQSTGKIYGAVCTPDFFGFNAERTLQYRGRLDDAKMGDASDRIPEMLNAMRLIGQTGKGPAKQHPGMGCSIKWS